VILIVLQDAQFRRILGEPHVFVSAGILGALVNAVCVVNSRGHHEFCTLLDIAFYLVGMWMVSDMSIMIAALEVGLLRAIVSCSADYPRMNKVHGILQQLPEATIHYYVLRAMRNGMKEVEDIVSGAEFVTSPMWDDWKKLADLISERGAIQNRCDSGVHALLRACDNVVVRLFPIYALRFQLKFYYHSVWCHPGQKHIQTVFWVPAALLLLRGMPTLRLVCWWSSSKLQHIL
jgi:hypothetical protein